MRRLVLVFVSFALAVPGFAQTAGKVPDYLGFYALNIPGFQWESGAKLEAEYRRLTGFLNLDHTRTPLFESEGHEPILLTLDQTSRLLLAVNLKKPLDLVGIDAKVTGGDGKTKAFFVVFLAISEGKPVNLIPSLTGSRTKSDPPDSSPKFPTPGDDSAQSGTELKGSY